jgi:hypothetical protein
MQQQHTTSHVAGCGANVLHMHLIDARAVELFIVKPHLLTVSSSCWSYDSFILSYETPSKLNILIFSELVLGSAALHIYKIPVHT